MKKPCPHNNKPCPHKHIWRGIHEGQYLVQCEDCNEILNWKEDPENLTPEDVEFQRLAELGDMKLDIERNDV